MVRETSRTSLSQTETAPHPRTARRRGMPVGLGSTLCEHSIIAHSVFDDEQTEASNDEFEMIANIPAPAPIRKRQRKKTSADMSFQEDQHSLVSSRKARRASGEHLWKHRCFWDMEETEHLREGVRKYGKGKWKAILSDPAFQFKDRSTVDLKDKWRNLETFVPWSDHEIRRYVLLDETHAPMRTATNSYHIFQNRDAALKVASRDDFYLNGLEDNTPFLIFLREIRTAEPIQSTENMSEEEQIVHVYQGTRERRIAADIEKFQNKRFMWVPSVIKMRTEKLSYGRKSTAVSMCAVLPAAEAAVMAEVMLLP